MSKDRLVKPADLADKQAPPMDAKRYLLISLWLASIGLAVFVLAALAAPLPPGHTPVATMLYDCYGQPLATFYAENRQPIPLKDVPLFMRHAVIATEDAGFYRHGGISFRGIIRAAWRDLTHGRVVEGASTITQQLARNVYLTPHRSIWRKLAEAFYAVKLELRLSKTEILTGYLNQVYFGEGAYGVQTASRAYFNRDPGELNQAEQAMMAGLLQAPERYSPWHRPDLARARMEQVLDRMVACGYLDRAAKPGVMAMPWRLCRPTPRIRKAPYFTAYIRDFLAELLPQGMGGVYTAGLKVQTTLDPAMQAEAEKALARINQYGADGPQGCLVAIDPSTGAIRAMVGGKNYNDSQFNRVTQAHRQPGSAFKPIVYADALEHGYTLVMRRDPTPRYFYLGQESYRPVDAARHVGLATGLSLREALSTSCNVVAVALGSELGPASIVDFAHKLGLESNLRPYLSLPLGTSEVTPLEMAAVYVCFANGGLRVPPFGVVSVRDSRGRLLYRAHGPGGRAIKQTTAFLLTQALGDVFGPGGTAAGYNPGRPAAGKTGTSDGNRDAWFAGYTPDLAAVVQIGYDQGARPLPGSGGALAAPIWSQFIRSALHGRAAKSFAIPPEIIKASICGETGDLAGSGCPARDEYFVTGTEPTVLCSLHRTVQMLICGRSKLLPGPHCRSLEMAGFKPGEEPARICDVCRGSLLEWLEKLFQKRRTVENPQPPVDQAVPAPSEPPSVKPLPPRLPIGRRHNLY